MNYGRKVIELDILHDIGLQRTEVKEVTAKLERTKANFNTDQQWLVAIENIVLSLRDNPLQQEVKKNALAVYQICPVCQRTCEKVSLSKTRTAYYCQAHRVVLPALAEE